MYVQNTIPLLSLHSKTSKYKEKEEEKEPQEDKICSRITLNIVELSFKYIERDFSESNKVVGCERVQGRVRGRER